MTWTDPEAGKEFFETSDSPTEGQISQYILDNLLSIPHVIDFTPDDLDVVSTTAETTFYSVTIPANSLGANGEVRMEIMGDGRGTGSVDGLLTTRVKFGGSTVITYTDQWINQVSRAGHPIQVRVVNQGATNAQLVDAGRAGSGGTGGLSGGGLYFVAPQTAAIDTTVDQALLISQQWTTSSATNSIRRLSARTLLARN